jgi:hypothetical protein
MLVFLHGAWFINPTYVGRDTFDGAAFVTGLSSSILMLDAFMQMYPLHYELIPCGEECWIDAVVFDSDFWAELHEYYTVNALVCPIPCRELTFPL